jgi:hypothetical protein
VGSWIGENGSTELSLFTNVYLRKYNSNNIFSNCYNILCRPGVNVEVNKKNAFLV